MKMADWNFFLWFILIGYGVEGILDVLLGTMRAEKSDALVYGVHTVITGVVKIILFVVFLVIVMEG